MHRGLHWLIKEYFYLFVLYMCFKIEVIFVPIKDEYQFNHDVTSALGNEGSFIEVEHVLVE